ncbi:HEAT repeat domain-containing protein [Candidatus Woesearchaeota archaeon]|nr:HEAT repeat domain-containing protein [Candidatus Woesearchaeota archaeon]
MNKNLLEELAKSHFEQKSQDHLLKTVYSKINDENLFEFFTIDNLLVQKGVARKINEQIQNQQFIEKIIAGLSGEPEIRQKILTALSYANNPKNGVLLPHIKNNLEHEDAEVRKAATKAISYKYPDHVAEVLPLLKTPDAQQIAKTLCYSRNTELIWPLLDFYGFPEKTIIPSWIGFLLNPVWLAQNYGKNPEAVSELIFRFGYSTCDVYPEALDLLNNGFMFVSQEMAKSPKPEIWKIKLNEILRQLLPDSFEMQSRASINLEDPIDLSIFTAAVRESDIINLEVKKEQDPFDYRTKELLTGVVVSHAPYGYFKNFIINKGMELGNELNVKKKDLGSFLVEYAKVMLQFNFEEAFAEEDIILRSKWLALSKLPEASAKSYSLHPKSWPIKDEDKDNFPLARFAVIKEFELPKQDKRLSVGAKGAVNLAYYLGISGLEDRLAEIEALYSKFLLPVGCEIQVPKPKPEINTSFAWKQALRYFGINSPRRPEYMETVEAAFRPSKTFHSQILGIAFLYKMGLFNTEQDMAYHISIQGELGEDVRYIVFPHRIITKSRIKIEEKNLRLKRMARLMSKGYVNLNNDAEPCCPSEEKPEYRTEMRVYSCCTDNVDGKIKLRTSFIDNIIDTQILSSALKSELPEFQELWRSYKEEIEKYAESLPHEFSELLHSNWYESTGDPRDGKLVGLLPIIQKKEEVSAIISEKNMSEELEKNFNQILGKYTRRAHQMFLNSFGVNYDFSSFLISDYGIPYLLPKDLLNASESQ